MAAAGSASEAAGVDCHAVLVGWVVGGTYLLGGIDRRCLLESISLAASIVLASSRSEVWWVL